MSPTLSTAIAIQVDMKQTLSADALVTNNLELETGDNFLLETGDFLLIDA